MATPLTDSKQVATALMELLYKHHVKIPRKRIMAYMNAAGLTLTALPDSYLKALDDEIVKMLKHPFLREVPSLKLDVKTLKWFFFEGRYVNVNNYYVNVF